MQEENFSPQDSLQLIQSMIAKTRRDMGDNSSHFLLWGWVTFAACTGQFILKNILNYQKHYMVWLLIIPAMLFSAYLGFKEGKKREAKTYIGESMKYLWMGMGISYFVLSMILSKMGWNTNIFPFFILLYGLGTFISGKLLQFKPLVFGVRPIEIISLSKTALCSAPLSSVRSLRVKKTSPSTTPMIKVQIT